MLNKNIPLIESLLGYSFHDKSLIALAFIHRSITNESKEITAHNERLEFLGDSVLGILIADYLYKKFPEKPEGELSYLRSRLVEAHSCMAYVTHLDCGKYLLLGRGERMNDGKGRETILADLFEAIVGAIYLDGGLDAAKSFIFHKLETLIGDIIETPIQNWKALLQEYCQKHFQKHPSYLILSEEGPDHHKTFTISVQVNERELGRGTGFSKKEAQQSAAEHAMLSLTPAP